MITSFVTNRPRLIIAFVCLMTVVAGLGLRRGLELDVSPLSFIADGDQERADFETARKYFGPDDYLVVAVVCDDVFAPENLARLRALHSSLTRLSGVSEVLSLVNVPYARSVGEQVEAAQLLPDAKTATAAQLAEARAVATRDPLYVGNVISADAKTAAFNILLNAQLPTVKRHELTRRIYALTKDAGFAESYFAGDPFSQMRSTEAMKGDLLVFLPFTIVLLAVVLWLAFRSTTAIWLPLLTIGIGLVWLLGLMAWLNARFTILVLMLPTLMLAVGCSYMVHVLNQIGIEYALEACDKKTLLTRALQFINLPVIVSALTIIAGFLSLAFTNIPAIRATSVYAAAGAAFTLFLSLTFIPAVLLMLPERALAFRADMTGGMVQTLAATGRWATQNQRLLYVATILIAVISVLGLRRIIIDVDFFHLLKKKAETTVGLAEIGRRLSGAVTFEIIIEGKQADAIASADVLHRIETLQQFAKQQRTGDGQGIDHTLAVTDFVKHIHQAFRDNDPRQAVIPDDDAVVQELLADRAQLRAFMTEDGRRARVLVRSSLSGSQAMANVIRIVQQRSKELFPEFRVYATGTLVLLNRTSDLIAEEQIKSVSIALVTIYIMLSLLFRSLRVGLTALVPNLIPILFFFGFMGWRGIYLNLTTSLVASLVLGLAVDNAVQFIVRFRRAQSAHPDLREAIIESMRLSGRPIIYANVGLAATFAVFAASNFEPIASFGLLSAVTILGCLLEDLVLLPSRLTSPVFRAK